MNEKELISLNSVDLDLNNESSIRVLQDLLSDLKDKGYSKIKVDIKTFPEQELKKSNLDGKIFNKIKETQELPDWVVINLMQASGKLKTANFKERF